MLIPYPASTAFAGKVAAARRFFAAGSLSAWLRRRERKLWEARLGTTRRFVFATCSFASRDASHSSLRRVVLCDATRGIACLPLSQKKYDM